MAVMIPIFLMQHYSTSSQQTGSTFHYLNKTNKSLPLQLIMTTIINDPILFKLTSHFCFFFFILFVSQIYQSVLYLAIVFVSTTFYRFYFYFVCIYVIVQALHVYMYKQNKKNYLCQHEGALNEIGSQSADKHLMGFDLGTFQFICNVITYQTWSEECQEAY